MRRDPETIETIISGMGETQLDEKIPEPELEALVAFLNSLTGEIPKAALQLPVLPPSTEQTSKPDVS